MKIRNRNWKWQWQSDMIIIMVWTCWAVECKDVMLAWLYACELYDDGGRVDDIQERLWLAIILIIIIINSSFIHSFSKHLQRLLQRIILQQCVIDAFSWAERPKLHLATSSQKMLTIIEHYSILCAIKGATFMFALTLAHAMNLITKAAQYMTDE